jgi:hypothetical protein
MSSRIRIFATHPQYGVFTGPAAKHKIADSAGMFWQADHHRDKTINHRAKRIGEQLGWTVKLFRVPKGVKLAKTEWGRFLASKGLFPYRERKGNNKVIAARQPNRLDIDEVLPMPGGGPLPMQPPVAGDIIWQNMVNLVGGIQYAGMGVAQAPPPQPYRPRPLLDEDLIGWEPAEPPEAFI